jgi:hypothetical protein
VMAALVIPANQGQESIVDTNNETVFVQMLVRDTKITAR